MEENLILAAFLALPVFLSATLFLFHRWRRKHPQPRDSLGRILGGNVLFLLVLLSVPLPCGEIYYRFL